MRKKKVQFLTNQGALILEERKDCTILARNGEYIKVDEFGKVTWSNIFPKSN